MLLLCPRTHWPDAEIQQRRALPHCREKRQSQDRYRRSGRGLKEAAQTLSSSNALFSPLFPAWDNTCLMDYSGARLILANRANLCPAHKWGEPMSFDVQVVNPLIASAEC
jgi:hypothetical protein